MLKQKPQRKIIQAVPKGAAFVYTKMSALICHDRWVRTKKPLTNGREKFIIILKSFERKICFMMKMQIQLDEQRVQKEGKYDLADMWRIIDEKFVEACTKEILPDGSRLYVGDANKDYYTCINVAAMILKQQKWFATYCKKWIWFDNDADEGSPFEPIDVLSRQRKVNALFAQR